MRLIQLFEQDEFGVETPSAEEVADKHGLPLLAILLQLKQGIKVEKEHTEDVGLAREIALDHLSEVPDYYTRLDSIDPH